MLERFNALPAWARYMIYAAIGILMLALVESFESGDPGRLTSVPVSQAMLRWSVPILLAGLGGLYSERAGVVNIGLEGMMILGTWCGAWGALEYGPWAGVLIGLLGGAFGGLLHAIATVSFGVDHIISGVAINILAPGVARFLSQEVFDNPTQSPDVGGLEKFNMPVLAGGDFFGIGTPDILGDIDDEDIFFVSDITGFLRGLMSELSLFTLMALVLVPITAWVVWKTRFGLRLRIAGENPQAGESLGVDIIRQKYIGVVISGALAGMGGAFISMELAGFFQEGQTTGRGFIGLAALIFGNWRPQGVLVAALLFGYPFGTSLRDLDGQSTHALLLFVALALGAFAAFTWTRGRQRDSVMAAALSVGMIIWYLASDTAPSWLPNTMPFALVIIVLVFASQRLRMPAADGQIYRKGET
ncbi:MAG: ABC transporter permease [Ilumatobacter sp.]|uniref:ABC transporter permease n=1 Tax=Ilumatobacter sp. TaxID=1967498 RepID=UPI002608027D|nr:ABC transporter permease [Ilumatobacter sp.]MDJ0767727.1 ABC transporter permease [Ilumatobacter sp.]